jgi:hypothetical protein
MNSQRPTPVSNLNIKKHQIKLKSDRESKSGNPSNRLRVKIQQKDSEGGQVITPVPDSLPKSPKYANNRPGTSLKQK